MKTRERKVANFMDWMLLAHILLQILTTIYAIWFADWRPAATVFVLMVFVILLSIEADKRAKIADDQTSNR